MLGIMRVKLIKAEGEKEKKYMKTNRNKQISRRHAFLFFLRQKSFFVLCQNDVVVLEVCTSCVKGVP